MLSWKSFHCTEGKAFPISSTNFVTTNTVTESNHKQWTTIIPIGPPNLWLYICYCTLQQWNNIFIYLNNSSCETTVLTPLMLWPIPILLLCVVFRFKRLWWFRTKTPILCSSDSRSVKSRRSKGGRKWWCTAHWQREEKDIAIADILPWSTVQLGFFLWEKNTQ